MKNNSSIPVLIACLFSCLCIAQRGGGYQPNIKSDNVNLNAADVADNNVAVVSYHVEERINMKFGSRVTTYDVSNINLVGTNDLGENNVRIVTKKFGKAKPAAATAVVMPTPNAETTIKPTGLSEIAPPAIEPVKPQAKAVEEHSKYAYIDILATYERVIDRGYKTVEMLSRVANGRFFKDDLKIAERYYSQLFEMTTDLSIEYYYRYARCLQATGQTEKAKQMMAVFEKKNAQTETPKAQSK